MKDRSKKDRRSGNSRSKDRSKRKRTSKRERTSKKAKVHRCAQCSEDRQYISFLHAVMTYFMLKSSKGVTSSTSTNSSNSIDKQQPAATDLIMMMRADSEIIQILIEEFKLKKLTVDQFISLTIFLMTELSHKLNRLRLWQDLK